MELRKGYWWQCERDASHATDFPGIVNFLVELAHHNWDQTLLTKPCHHCGSALRVTYAFPRKDRGEFSVVHIVGLKYDTYIPMMWETREVGASESLFDFKYVGKSGGAWNNWGLNKPAVFNQAELADLFALYGRIVGVEQFP